MYGYRKSNRKIINECFNIKFDEKIFDDYVTKYKEHLFEDIPFIEILSKCNNNYRARKITYIYIIKNRIYFKSFINLIDDLGLFKYFDILYCTLNENKEFGYSFNILSEQILKFYNFNKIKGLSSDWRGKYDFYNEIVPAYKMINSYIYGKCYKDGPTGIFK